MARIELVYFNAGGGHRAAARALEAVLHERRPHWSVLSVNLFEMLDPADRFRRVAGIAPEDLYNIRLKSGWTAGMAQELKLLQASIRLGHGLLVRRLLPHWPRSRPDLVVSLIPHFNRALIDSLNRALPGVPLATVMTDLADFPPRFWIEPDTDQHVICGSERAQAQAQTAGCAAHRIHRVSGMLLHPDFHAPLEVDRERECAALGLDPAQPIGIVMFGGHGSAAMQTIAAQLRDLQLILICGHNEALAGRLRRASAGAPHAVLGFTSQMRRYMQLGRYFIGKPGPGSLSEAVHVGLPVITFRNAWTLPQERYNTEWVREQRLGLVVRSVRAIRPAVLELLADADAFRASVRRLRNRAVFEVPEVLAAVLAQSSAAHLSPASQERAA